MESKEDELSYLTLRVVMPIYGRTVRTSHIMNVTRRELCLPVKSVAPVFIKLRVEDKALLVKHFCTLDSLREALIL